MVHDKSSLAPEGKTVAFNLGNEEGFYWLDGYGDITAEELLSGFSHDTKTALAENLIRDLLADGKEVTAKKYLKPPPIKTFHGVPLMRQRKTLAVLPPERWAKAGRGRYPE